MTGIVSVNIHDSRNSYSFKLRRNITVLCGESGRGKTTLFDMIEDYNRYGKSSATKVSCNRELFALRGKNWKDQIDRIIDAVIVIDEDSDFIRSNEFAETVKKSGNYFLIITRCYLPQLPISVNEIYEISGNKNKSFKPLYVGREYMYEARVMRAFPFKPDIIITEDSKAGYQFFKVLASLINAECYAAKGKTKVYKKITEYPGKNILVIADGAAFGTEVRDIVERQKLFPKKIGIFLPESFEWLILKSGIVCDPKWEKISMPEEYIDSKKYFSWEQYFTDVLIEVTRDVRYKRYPKSKSNIPKHYIEEKSLNKVKEIIKGIAFK